MSRRQPIWASYNAGSRCSRRKPIDVSLLHSCFSLSFPPSLSLSLKKKGRMCPQVRIKTKQNKTKQNKTKQNHLSLWKDSWSGPSQDTWTPIMRIPKPPPMSMRLGQVLAHTCPLWPPAVPGNPIENPQVICS